MTRHVLLLAAFGLIGCEPVGDDKKDNTGEDTGDTMGDDDDMTVPTGETGVVDPDDDMDGYTVGDGDCNDADPAINPGAEELCDTIDNNCDKAVDDAAAATLDGVNYATLDEAVAVSAAGSILDVCPGSWTVTALDIGKGDDLTFFGVAGAAATSIAEASALSVASVGDGGVLTLDDVTVTGAVLVPGVEVGNGGTLMLNNAMVSGNTGGGLYINAPSGGAVIDVTGSTIDGNSAPKGSDGGGIYAFEGFTLTITDSTISGNDAFRGGGMYVASLFSAGTVTLSGATIEGNTAEVGGGIVAWQNAVVGDGASFIQNNSAISGGGGVGLYRSPLSDVLVSGNDSLLLGGGVMALFDNLLQGSPSNNVLTGVTVDSNTADSGGGLYVVGREMISVDGYSAVTTNTAATGGGAFVESLGTLVSDGADWGGYSKGTPGGPGENTPDDVWSAQSYSAYSAGAVFTCDGSVGCSN